MARPREFDPDDVIERATRIFWEKGYEGATLPDLLEGMNLSRGSFYKAFEHKKLLFLMVLDHYAETSVKSAIALLTDKNIPDGRDRILALFTQISKAAEQGNHNGCLLCSAAAGPSYYDLEIAQSVNDSLDDLRGAFLTAVSATRAAAEKSVSAQQRLADVLIGQYVGLRVLARSKVPPSALMAGVDGIADIVP